MEEMEMGVSCLGSVVGFLGEGSIGNVRYFLSGIGKMLNRVI